MKPPLLIERLEKPSWRSDAPVGMQHYAENHRDANGTTIRERWNGVIARPGVQAALQKVGRVEAFAIAQGLR
jgi:hypothetical protein